MEKLTENPCRRCILVRTCDEQGCADYQKWVNSSWDRFRRYYLRTVNRQARETLRYMHPDEAADYVKSSPCNRCCHARGCAKPCDAYLQWYDVHMALFRAKYGHLFDPPGACKS